MFTMNHFLGIERVPESPAVNRFTQRSTIDWEAIMLALLCEHAGIDTYEVLDRMNPDTVMMHIICSNEDLP